MVVFTWFDVHTAWPWTTETQAVKAANRPKAGRDMAEGRREAIAPCLAMRSECKPESRKIMSSRQWTGTVRARGEGSPSPNPVATNNQGPAAARRWDSLENDLAVC